MKRRMNVKRVICLLLCCLLMSGCTNRMPASEPAATLGPVKPLYPVPEGLHGMTYKSTVALSLPSRDGSRLLVEYEELELDRSEHCARTIVEALLSYPGNEDVRSLGMGKELGLYGRNPVEVAGGVCTVNLTSSALQLEKNDFYTVCLALAATLNRLDDISYVNVLVCDRAIGLDISGYLPAGAVSTHVGEELTTLWELMEAKKTPLGQNAGTTQLSSVATLYFPLADGSGIMPETRNLTFSGQTPIMLTYGLLNAMSAGAQYLTDTAKMPDILALLTQDPVISEQADGSQMITLHFTSELESRLAVMGLEPMCFTAAVVCTLTTYIPSVSAVCIVSGSTMMTNLYSRVLGSVTFRNGNQRRTQYTDLIRGEVTIYLAQNGQLVPVQRTLPASEAYHPASLFALLSAGPNEGERKQGITAVFPTGLTASDVLGMAITDGTLLVNLSERTAQAIAAHSSNEMLTGYSLVTTLCKAADLRRIRFWFAGDMEDKLAGSLFWSGEFMLNMSIVNVN